MNTVTVSGWLQAKPAIERFGDLAVCGLSLAVEWPSNPGRTGMVAITCFGRLAHLAVERLAVGDHIEVTSWLSSQPVDAGACRIRRHIDVIAERPEFLGHPEVAPDAHLEAAYDDRFELGEVS